MANFIDDTINFGFGLFAYSRDKLEEIVDKLVDAGKVEKQDAKGLMHDLMQKGEEQRAEIKKMVKEEVSSTMEDLGVKKNGVTKEEIREIIREELAKKD